MWDEAVLHGNREKRKMRFLSKIFFSNPISNKKSILFRLLESQHSNFATRSKSWKNSKSKATRSRKSSKPSLYQKISEIISTQDPSFDQSCSQVSIFRPAVSEISRIESGRQGVCYNAHESAGLENAGETCAENVVLEDVSPLVRKITEIVRLENSGMGMEERLEALDCEFSSEIVEKVLKRCFKVGHLALRFFNWVKLCPGFRHTTETYNVMLYIAGEAEEFGVMEKLVGGMAEDLCPKNIKTWTIVISKYGNAKQVGKALEAFDQMKKSGCCPDKSVYEVVLRALFGAKKGELAMEFYKEMVFKNMEIDRKLYGELMTCLARCGNIAGVRSVGDDLIKVAEIPGEEAYACLLRSFCVAGKVEEARELFEDIKRKGLFMLSDVYEILLKGFCRAGKMTDAVQLVDGMKHHFTVDSKSYGCLIDGFLRKGDIGKALDVFHATKKLGFLPMVSSYTHIIQYLFRSSEYKKACDLYKEMLENGIEPDIVAMTAIVAGHVHHDHISEAWEVFERMKKKLLRPSPKAYTVFIKELCKASKPDEAVKVLNEMLASNVNPNKDIIRLVEFTLTRKGDIAKARKVEHMFRSFHLQGQDAEMLEQSSDYLRVPDTNDISNSSSKQEVNITQTSNIHETCEISNCLSKQEKDTFQTANECRAYSDNDLKKVCNILSSSIEWSSMQEALEKSTVHFTSELVEAVLRKSQRHGSAALNFFSWIGKQNEYKHNTDTYNMAIKTAGSAKDFRHMRNLYYEMKRRGFSVSPNTWTIMISQYGQAGLTEIALNTFKEMKAQGYQPNASTFKFLVVFLCGRKGQKLDEAIKIFQEMIHAGHMPDREMLDVYLCALCELGRMQDATKAVKSLCKRGFMPQLGFSALIKSMCRAGRLEEGLKLANDLQHHSCKMDSCIYGSIIHALLRRGCLTEALDKVEAMKKAGISETVHINTSLIVHFCKEKQIEKAIDIFKKMRAEGCEPTIVTYSALIRGYMNMGMVSKAWDIFHRMKLKGPIPDFETYSMFITCLCKAGRSEEAIKLVDEMLEDGIIPSAVNFRTLFHGLNREGKQDLAHSVLKTKWLLNRKRKFLT